MENKCCTTSSKMNFKEEITRVRRTDLIYQLRLLSWAITHSSISPVPCGTHLDSLGVSYCGQVICKTYDVRVRQAGREGGEKGGKDGRRERGGRQGLSLILRGH